MTEADLPAVVTLAAAIHPHHPESPAVYAERLALAPAGCLVLAASGGIAGYALSHPWTGLAPPPLNGLLDALPPVPAAWHIHDVALAPALRGRGLGGAVVRRLLAATALPRATLVALPGLGATWAALGFTAAACADAPALASYGAGAAFLARPGAGSPG